MGTFGELLFRVADNRCADSMASRLRARRFERFAIMAKNCPPPVRVLDVGGTADFWSQHVGKLEVEAEITIANLEIQPPAAARGVHSIQADARDLRRYPNKSFDLIFSNSLLEHVGTFRQQTQAASELRRVGRGYFIQTPNYYFPIEPHFLFPGWQFLPIRIRTLLIQSRELGWMPRLRDEAEARAAAKSIRLLTAREMKRLFPDAILERECVGPFTKSLIAIREYA